MGNFFGCFHVKEYTRGVLVSCNQIIVVNYGVLDVVDVNNAKKAFYVHGNSRSLLEAYAFDVIKTTISKNTFDELFEKKDEFTSTVNEKLNEMISGEYGFGNFKTLILDVSPDEPTKCTMNVTNSAPKIALAVRGATPEVIQMLLATLSGPANKLTKE